MIDVSGWRKRQIALEKKADNARELGLGYGCAECGADGGTALYCVACAEKYVSKETRMTKDEAQRLIIDAQNMASKSTYKEQLETKEYERGFIDGMQKQMQSSVDKAVNAMGKREWVGLTDEEIESTYMDTINFQENARALEAKLKERNT